MPGWAKFSSNEKPRRTLAGRLVAHHLPLLVITCGGSLTLYFTRPYRDAVTRASFATAYPALLLLALTLLTGPLNTLMRRRNPISSDLRRDIGIWAGIFSIAHSVIGQCVHLRGRPWLYYIYDARQGHWFPMRHDLFGFANYAGLAGTLIVMALLASSNDYSLRRLGTPGWKKLQRWNYAVFALVAAHAVGYVVIEKQKLPFDLVISIAIAVTVAVQAAGYVRRCAG
jgi:sulfoxide reductase heme-binding subunit YedZ